MHTCLVCGGEFIPGSETEVKDQVPTCTCLVHPDYPF